MRRAKQQGSDIAGDWSVTGTFLRKPSGGWLHEDRELQNGLSINYNVQYMGSVVVNNSMRTLQFNVRTQVTKEAIMRLAEHSGNIFVGKKKKVPKQVDKILGAMETRWAGEVNLSVSVDSLKICNEVGGMVILNHSLPSISFASGGDGATADYIGYVAKDPVHGRACHVFECPRSSQYVLASIGQAFELRYKMYLNKSSSRSVQPVEVASSWDTDVWGRVERETGFQVTADIHPARNQGSTENEASGIYSDIPDIPAPDSPPPPIPTAMYTLAGRPGANGNGHVPTAHPRLENPYDTMEISTRGTSEATGHQKSFRLSDRNDYEDADLITTATTTTAPSTSNGVQVHEEGGEYSTTFVSIRQSRINDSQDEIDLTPASKLEPHDYSNVDLPEEKPVAKKRPVKPTPFQRKTSPGGGAATASSPRLPSYPQPSSAEFLYDNHSVEKALDKRLGNLPSQPQARSSYDPPMELKEKPPVKKKPVVLSRTRSGMYDDPDEIIKAKQKIKPQKPSREGIVDGSLRRDDIPEEDVYNTPEAVYDDQGHILMGGASGGTSSSSFSFVPPSPKFDDRIYMDSGGNRRGGGLESMASVGNSLPDPLAPLSQQNYFHGPLSRVEAEALVISNGEFLIRESTKKPGQYVLTGMAADKAQHLLLMDKQGKVKSKDREFESVPHLIKHFTESSMPLYIGNSQVYLRKPVINAFLNT